jgi:riboflavin kinase/FMN adenylyltransferase
MEIIRGLANLSKKHQHSALTIGKFDGVHLGHQKLFQHITHYAKTHHLNSMAIVFEPSPYDFFSKNSQKIHLTPLKEKILYIAQSQINYLLIIPFNETIANQKAIDFIQHTLIQCLKIKKLWVGDDFRFGFKRQGDFALLQQYADKKHFSLSQIDTHYINQTRVSSSSIRQLIIEKNFAQAEKLLGHPLSIAGLVIRGQQLGKTIGYPTANLRITKALKPTLSLLSFGVYFVRLVIENTKIDAQKANNSYYGVANYGIKPTIKNKNQLSFETHCFNMSENLYDSHIRLEILHFIRLEKEFSSIDELKQQIAQDIQKCNNFKEWKHTTQ